MLFAAAAPGTPSAFPAEARDNPPGLISVTRSRWVPERRIDCLIEVATGEMRCCAAAPAKPRLIEADVFYRRCSVSRSAGTFPPTRPLTLSVSAAAESLMEAEPDGPGCP